jgi:Mg2+ and Co2+ transporter CorA
MKKRTNENETNSEDNLAESNTDKDSSIQATDSNSQNSSADNDNQPLTRKTARKSNSNVKIEDYDLIVNSLKEATTSFKDVIYSISKKAQEIRDKAEETFTVGAKRDARDIQALGIYVESVTKGFEDTMMEIKKRNYADEEKLLKGYKKLLEEQINLINARVELVKRLKSR